MFFYVFFWDIKWFVSWQGGGPDCPQRWHSGRKISSVRPPEWPPSPPCRGWPPCPAGSSTRRPRREEWPSSVPRLGGKYRGHRGLNTSTWLHCCSQSCNAVVEIFLGLYHGELHSRSPEVRGQLEAGIATTDDDDVGPLQLLRGRFTCTGSHCLALLSVITK